MTALVMPAQRNVPALAFSSRSSVAAADCKLAAFLEAITVVAMIAAAPAIVPNNPQSAASIDVSERAYHFT